MIVRIRIAPGAIVAGGAGPAGAAGKWGAFGHVGLMRPPGRCAVCLHLFPFASGLQHAQDHERGKPEGKGNLHGLHFPLDVDKMRG